MRVFFNAIFVQILLSLYIYWRGWQALPDKKYIKVPYTAIFIIELVIYFIGFFTSRHLPYDALHNFAWVGTTWMLFTIYMTSLLLVYDIFWYANRKRRVFPTVDLNAKKIRFTYFCSAFLIVVGVMGYGSYRFWNPVVTEMNLTVDKTSPDIKNLRLVVAADIHSGHLIDKHIVSMYIDKIMEQKPDIILLVGDVIDYDIRALYEQRMETEFLRLKAPYGVYASTGNHEYIQIDGEEKDEKINWLSDRAGMTVLRDSVVLIADSFYLVGREDEMNKERKPLAEIMQTFGVDKSLPVIVMNHEPHNLQEEADNGADIALYGHTHYGQFFPVNTFMALASKVYNTGIFSEESKFKFMYEVPYGYKMKGNTHAYVTSGLGLAGPQYRIGTVSEIVVLNVSFK